MKSLNTHQIRIVGALIAMAVSNAYSATSYVMQDIGTLFPEGPEATKWVNSAAYAINESGVIAGDSGMGYQTLPTTPFVFANDVMTNLSRNPGPYASDYLVVADISNNGLIVGNAGTPNTFTMIYQNGAWSNLGQAYARGVNDSGVVVGSRGGQAAYYKDGSWHDITWNYQNGSVPNGYTVSSSYAVTVDSVGVIHGNAVLVSSLYQPYGTNMVFGVNTNSTNPQGSFYVSCCTDVSLRDSMNRSISDVNGFETGVWWTAAGQGGHPAGSTTSAAFFDLGSMTVITEGMTSAINKHGQVVGWYKFNGQDRAFLWDNGELMDLGTFGGSQSRAYDINDAGQIVGWAMLPGDTAYHAFLAEPVPEPETWAMLLAGLGLLGFRLRKHKSR